MKTPRVYLDTSVIGGYFDPEFEKPTRKLFDEIAAGRFIPVVSDIVAVELIKAPDRVRDMLANADIDWQRIAETPETLALAHAYVSAGILAEKWLDDCRHVAAATINGVDMVISWNFRHIVHYDKIRAFNGVNLRAGYREIEIRSPREVINYDD